jgi:hypothetical protein
VTGVHGPEAIVDFLEAEGIVTEDVAQEEEPVA